MIPLVQGKEVAKRSVKSITSEIEKLYVSGVSKINDLTLPTLNMYGSKCALYKYSSKIFSPVIDSTISEEGHSIGESIEKSIVLIAVQTVFLFLIIYTVSYPGKGVNDLIDKIQKFEKRF